MIMPNSLFPRLEFRSGEQNKFMMNVLLQSKLEINKLAKFAGVSPRTIRDWKREKYRISKDVARLFCKAFKMSLTENEEILIERWKKTRRKGSSKGGRARIAIYGNPGTLEGRRKGGSKSIKILRESGAFLPAKNFLQPAYCKELAEWVGIVLGDGGITNYQVRIALNSIVDVEYASFVRNLSRKLYGEKPSMFYGKNKNVIYLCLSGINLIKILKKIGLKTGNKVTKQVEVPQWILNNKNFRIFCVRGLMDTDGGIFLHKYKVNGKEYIYKKICFSNRSLPLLCFVHDVLKELDLTPKIRDNVENTSVWLYNTREVVKYLNLVGSSNLRLLKHKGGVA